MPSYVVVTPLRNGGKQPVKPGQIVELDEGQGAPLVRCGALRPLPPSSEKTPDPKEPAGGGSEGGKAEGASEGGVESGNATGSEGDGAAAADGNAVEGGGGTGTPAAAAAGAAKRRAGKKAAPAKP